MFNVREWLGLGYYTSKLDIFLNHFRKQHPTLSPSQQAEVNKYKVIHKLRDSRVKITSPKTFWDKF